MLQILQAPNIVLSESSRKVEEFDSTLKKLIKDMTLSLESARDPIGVGLAACQIGVDLRVFIAKPTEKSKIAVFVNPQILQISPLKKGKKIKKHGKKLEGCLSLKDIWGEVRRSNLLTLEYFDINGKKKTQVFKDFMATVVQHEIDHLDGVLFTQRVLEQKGHLYQSSKDEKGIEVFEKIKI